MTRALTSLTLLAWLLSAAAAQQPPTQPQPQPDAASADVSIHGYGDREKTCQEWTDGCRSCQRDAKGDPVCSNIGPACQPGAITCARRSEPAK